jgi:hypothetical protein
LATTCIILCATFCFLLNIFPPSLELDNLWLLNPNIGAHRLCARENSNEMPPKRGPERSSRPKPHLKRPELRLSKQPKQPTKHRLPQSLNKQPQRLEYPKSHRDNHQANGGLCYEHLRANHSEPNPAARHRSSRRTVARLGRGD